MAPRAERRRRRARRRAAWAANPWRLAGGATPAARDAAARLLGGPRPVHPLARAAGAPTLTDAGHHAVAGGMPAAWGQAAARLHRQRAAARAARLAAEAADPVHTPVWERWTERRVREAYRAGGYRGAAQGHRLTVVVGGGVVEGAVEYTAERVAARDLGLPRAYGPTALCTWHRLTVRSDWLRSVWARDLAVHDGRLVLSARPLPDCPQLWARWEGGPMYARVPPGAEVLELVRARRGRGGHAIEAEWVLLVRRAPDAPWRLCRSAEGAVRALGGLRRLRRCEAEDYVRVCRNLRIAPGAELLRQCGFRLDRRSVLRPLRPAADGAGEKQ